MERLLAAPRVAAGGSIVKDERLLESLIEKRAEIAGEVIELEKKLGSHRASLVHIDATLKLLDPDIRLSEIRAKRPMYARSGYFAPGELTRRCNDAARVAGPSGVSAEEVALVALRDKQLDPADETLRSDFIKRIHYAMDRLQRTQIMRRVGKGRGVRWALREENHEHDPS
jgi:hypothetical protein